MWNWFNCYLSGRHEYGVWCEPGAIFLRCVHCGKRSSGWALEPKPATAAVVPPTGIKTRSAAPFSAAAAAPVVPATASVPRVLPFTRTAS